MILILAGCIEDSVESRICDEGVVLEKYGQRAAVSKQYE
jgi:hypothetical protein